MKKNHRVSILILLTILLSCTTFVPSSPPYVYVSVELENGIDADRTVLLIYTVKNITDRSITEIQMYGELTDDLNKNYKISRLDSILIEPGKVGTVTADISNHFYYLAKSLKVATFYIRKIVFEDDSIWEDPEGYYTYPYQ